MIRKLKTLGLTLVAVTVLGAVSAAAASAQTQGMFTTDGPSATLDVTETGGAGANGFTAPGTKVECPGTTAVGHEVGNTTKAVPNKAKAVTITPTYKGCKGTVGKNSYPLTITLNGCDFVYHIGETVAANTYATTVDIVCPPGKAIVMEFFMDDKHTMKLCEDSINPVNNVVGPHIKSTPADDDVDITGSEAVKVSQTGLCGEEESEEAAASFDVDLTVKGTNSTGGATGITVTD